MIGLDLCLVLKVFNKYFLIECWIILVVMWKIGREGKNGGREISREIL